MRVIDELNINFVRSRKWCEIRRKAADVPAVMRFFNAKKARNNAAQFSTIICRIIYHLSKK